MCNFSGRLVAWMDGEVAGSEAGVVERHVQACTQCRERVAAYAEASRSFAAYYAATARTTRETRAKATRKPTLWVPAAAALAAAAVVLVVALMPRPVEEVPVLPQVVTLAPPAIEKAFVHPVKLAEQRHLPARKKTPRADLALAQPAIQIAIPGEAMFPPGAVPEGATYIANLSLAADGSVQGVRLQQ